LVNWLLVLHDDAVFNNVCAAQVELVLGADVVVPEHQIDVLLPPRLLPKDLESLLELFLFLWFDGRTCAPLQIGWHFSNIAKDGIH
jgi:hypothetical protein